MKKFTILIPVYNDWESLNKLLSNINDKIKSFLTTEELITNLMKLKIKNSSILIKGSRGMELEKVIKYI